MNKEKSIPHWVYVKGVSNLTDNIKKDGVEPDAEGLLSGYEVKANLDEELQIYKIWVTDYVESIYYFCFITDKGQVIEIFD